jgi:hypothetical protein
MPETKPHEQQDQGGEEQGNAIPVPCTQVIMPLATAALLITIAANIANNSSAGFRSIEVYIGTKQYESARVGTHETVVTKTKAGIKGMKGVDTKGSWHSQSGQDKTIAKLHGLKRGGFFIDLASNEPIHLSNTRTLEQIWAGMVFASMQMQSCSRNPSSIVRAAAYRRS